ncbi:hypothetical protein ILYODFUR_029103 [Ilyodon furcidens]|uniref:Uncharacterized protein n=1 Tax=Ilyodon furcidens TaxID=33524 RepID=A0ABV0V8P4_9TELE
MSLHCGRKLEYPLRTHACTGRTCKLRAERLQALEPRTLWLQGNSATNCVTVQSPQNSNSYYLDITRPFYVEPRNIVSDDLQERISAEAAILNSRVHYYSRLTGSSDTVLSPPNHVIPTAEEIYIYSPLGTAFKVPDSVQASKNPSIVTIFAIWNTMMGTSILSIPWGIKQAINFFNFFLHILWLSAKAVIVELKAVIVELEIHFVGPVLLKTESTFFIHFMSSGWFHYGDHHPYLHWPTNAVLLLHCHQITKGNK